MAILLTRNGKEIAGAGNVSELSAENKKIVNVANPTNDQDAATKAYVDTATATASNALDGTFRIKNTADETKQIAFDASTIAAGTTRTILMPNANVDLGLVATAIQSSEKGAANGVATLNASGKLSSSQVPAIAITDTFVVSSEAAMLALSAAERGDVAVRTDVSKSFILAGDDFATLADWQELLTPMSPVQSVNGQQGAVVLDTDDIAEGSTNLYYTTARFDSAFSGKTTSDLLEGTNLYFTEARVLSTILDGFTVGANSEILLNDTVFQAFQKTQGQINNRISKPVAPNDGDILVFDSGTNEWVAEPAPVAPVSSVNGQTGAVVLDSDDIAEGSTNLYFTDARAKAAAVADSIADGVTDVAPSQNAVFDALALKADASAVSAIDDRVDVLESQIGKVYDVGVAGESFAAGGVFLVRRAKNGETAGRYYKAQANSAVNSSVVGWVNPGSAISAGQAFTVYKLGAMPALNDGDDPYAASDLSLPVYLSQTSAGLFTLAPVETTGSWIKLIGYVADSDKIEFQPGVLIQA